MRTSAKWLFLKFKRFQVGCKYYFANTHKMGFYGAFSVASLLQAVSSTILPTMAKWNHMDNLLHIKGEPYYFCKISNLKAHVRGKANVGFGG